MSRFIRSGKPHAIAVGCDSIVTRDVMKEIVDIIQELHDDDVDFPLIKAEYLPIDVASVFSKSQCGQDEFPDYPLKLRQSISLARRLRDPLVELSQLCNYDRNILGLQYHPMQHLVSQDLLHNALTQEFVNRVNEVGVDVNLCLTHPYLVPLVQFICGFGPRKGAHLLRQLRKKQYPYLENRTQLVQACSIGKIVFINCAGFIRIATMSMQESGTETYIEILDSTRVHPEGYEWARKMAVDALDYDNENSDPAQALEEIIANPEKLRDLDLDEFAKELKRQDLGLKNTTLYDIRSELTHQYQDRRTKQVSPTIEEIFYMLTDECEKTFHVGKLISVMPTGFVRRKPKKDSADTAHLKEDDRWTCIFCKRNDFKDLPSVWAHFDSDECPGQATGVKVELDNGLRGTIKNKFLSDSFVADPTTRVQVRKVPIICRVLEIYMDRFYVDLTSRSSDLNDENNRFKPPRDVHFDYDAMKEALKSAQDAKAKKLNKVQIMKRLVFHPCFKNISFPEAEKILSEASQGEVIIRPSSKGSNLLSLAWKVYDGIHQYITIREERKAYDFSLGKELFIGSKSFEDLDEIIALHIRPMAQFAQDLIKYKYFVGVHSEEEIVAKIKEKFKANPSMIPYVISVSKGMF